MTVVVVDKDEEREADEKEDIKQTWAVAVRAQSFDPSLGCETVRHLYICYPAKDALHSLESRLVKKHQPASPYPYS